MNLVIIINSLLRISPRLGSHPFSMYLPISICFAHYRRLPSLYFLHRRRYMCVYGVSFYVYAYFSFFFFFDGAYVTFLQGGETASMDGGWERVFVTQRVDSLHATRFGIGNLNERTMKNLWKITVVL